ncbi:hypothetical protein SALBM311S_03134 [Streptomyces alboniger]
MRCLPRVTCPHVDLRDRSTAGPHGGTRSIAAISGALWTGAARVAEDLESRDLRSVAGTFTFTF